MYHWPNVSVVAEVTHCIDGKSRLKGIGACLQAGIGTGELVKDHAGRGLRVACRLPDVRRVSDASVPVARVGTGIGRA
jgi:hypothetical protein